MDCNTGQGTLSAMVDDLQLPLPSNSIDHIKALHSVEFCRDINVFMKEIVRILKGGGRFTFIVPNRRGLWARFDNNPFGFGHPYTRTQLIKLLDYHGFEIIQTKRILFSPPIRMPLFAHFIPFLDIILRPLIYKFSGLLMIEAKKEVFAGIVKPQRKFKFSWAPEAAEPIKA
jgi:SAM-dependent methyltransferase